MFVELFKNGYVAIPQQVGGDTPGKAIVTYKDKFFDDDDATKWDDAHSDANVALVTGAGDYQPMAIDFDCTNRAISNKAMHAIRKRWPNIPVRRCNDPKFVVLFRPADDMQSIKNGHSDVYHGRGGIVQQVELAGWNSLITIYGQHRKPPYNDYSWGRGGRNPLSMSVWELPELTKEDVDWIFEMFNRNAHKVSDWEQKGHQNFTFHMAQGTHGDPFADAPALGQQFTMAEVDDFMSVYNGDTREVWLKGGMCLHEVYRGGPEGLMKWINWSRQYANFEEGACESAWPELKLGGGVTPATVQKEVVKKVKDEAEGMLAEMTENLVLITEGQRVGDIRRASAESITTVPESRTYYSNKRVETITDKGEIKKTGVFNTWLTSEARRTVHSTAFVPVRDRIISNIADGHHEEYWNMYVSPEHVELDTLDQRHLKIFMDHIHYVFDGPGDAEWMLAWLADMVQNPTERPTITPLHINPNQRTGRGWVTNMITALVGGMNVGQTDLDEISSSSAKDGYLDNNLAVFIHEIKPISANNLHAQYDALKSVLTEKNLNLDIKYGASGMRKIYARFFMMSNHKNCLPLGDGDGRINVMDSYALPKEKEYYDVLYHALEHEKGFMDTVFTYLLRRKYNKSTMTTPRHTEAKTRMVNAARSQVARGLFRVKQALGPLPFTDKMLTNAIENYLESVNAPADKLGSGELYHLMIQEVHPDLEFRLTNGKVCHVKTFAEYDLADEETFEEQLKLTEAKLKELL